MIEITNDLHHNGLVTKQKRRVNGAQGSNHFMLFGTPKFKDWAKSRVQKKAVWQGANGGSLAGCERGQTIGIPITKGEIQASILRVIGGGRCDE